MPKFILLFLLLSCTFLMARGHEDSVTFHRMVLEAKGIYPVNRDSAMQIYRNALDVADKAKLFDDSVATVSYRVAYADYYLGNTEKAAKLALKTLGASTARHDTNGMIRLMLLMGDILRGSTLHDQAYQYINDAKKLAIQSDNRLRLAEADNRLAAVYLEDKRYPDDTAFVYAQKSLAIARQDNLPLLVYNNLNIMSLVETQRENYHKSISLLEEAYPLVVRYFPDDEALILVNQARNYKYLGKVEKSKQLNMRALKLAEERKIPQYIRLACLNLEIIFMEEGNYREAYHYMTLYYQNKEFILTQQVQVKLREFQQTMENERQLAETRQLMLEQKSARNERNYLLALGILLISLLSASVVFLVRQYRLRVRTKLIAHQLTQSNKVLRRFISVLAHDLRSPFNAILGFTDILRNEPDLSDDDRNLATEKLYSVSSSTYRLLERLLEWSQLQSGSAKPVLGSCDLSAMVSETIQSLEPAALLKKIGLQWNPHGPQMVMADMNMVMTCIRNLISNAIKFTHPGGNVMVDIVRSGKFLTLRITDNGVGIEPDVLPKLFMIEENYKSTGTAGEKGTGLGLILCREYIEMNNGFLKVDSKPGAGSRFEIWLPVA